MDSRPEYFASIHGMTQGLSITAKTALITGNTGKDCSYWAEVLLSKGYEAHTIKLRTTCFNTTRIDGLCSMLSHARSEFDSVLLNEEA